MDENTRKKRARHGGQWALICTNPRLHITEFMGIYTSQQEAINQAAIIESIGTDPIAPSEFKWQEDPDTGGIVGGHPHTDIGWHIHESQRLKCLS